MAKKIDRGECINCRWWSVFDEGFGFCKRNSPLPRFRGEEDAAMERYCAGFGDGDETTWPLVCEIDWCGDFQKIEN